MIDPARPSRTVINSVHHVAGMCGNPHPFFRKPRAYKTPPEENPAASQNPRNDAISNGASTSNRPHPATRAACAAAFNNSRPIPRRRCSSPTNKKEIRATSPVSRIVRYQSNTTTPLGGPHSTAISAAPAS